MNFSEFERIISRQRLERYMIATNKSKEKTIKLYNANLNLAKEMFVVISYFEVALRNAIDGCLTPTLGQDWLRDSAISGGRFDCRHSEHMCKVIRKRYESLLEDDLYSHSKLLSSLEFGIWKYMFADFQYRITGQVLLSIFPEKPKSSAIKQYDNTFFFNELNHINTLRNRIAHHEPICFSNITRKADTGYVQTQYKRIMNLLKMMQIDNYALFNGMNYVKKACEDIELIALC